MIRLLCEKIFLMTRISYQKNVSVIKRNFNKMATKRSEEPFQWTNRRNQYYGTLSGDLNQFFPLNEKD